MFEYTNTLAEALLSLAMVGWVLIIGPFFILVVFFTVQDMARRAQRRIRRRSTHRS